MKLKMIFEAADPNDAMEKESGMTRRDFVKRTGSAVAANQPGLGGALVKAASKVAAQPFQFPPNMEDQISDMWYWGIGKPSIPPSMVRAWVLKNENTPYWAASNLGAHEKFDQLTGGAAGEITRRHLGHLSTPEIAKTIWNAATEYADGTPSTASLDAVEILGASLGRCADFGVHVDLPPKILAGVGVDPGASDYVLKMVGLDDPKRIELVKRIQRIAASQHEYRKRQDATQRMERERDADLARWADDGGWAESFNRRLGPVLNESLKLRLDAIWSTPE